MRRAGYWRRAWPWIGGSLALHLLLLAALPGADSDDRCPVMLLVTLQAPAVEPPPLAAQATLPPPIQPALEQPRPQKQPPKPATKPAPQQPAPAKQPASEPEPPRRVITAQRDDSVSDNSVAVLPPSQPQLPAEQPAPRQPETPAQPPADPAPAAQPPAAVEPPPVAEPLPDQGALRNEYASYVRGRIGARQFVPEAARTADNAGLTARVTVELRIGRSGALASVSVVSSSGISAIDDAALQAVRSAAPFRAFPADLLTESVRLQVPLAYKIR